MAPKNDEIKGNTFDNTELDALEEAINILLYQLLCPNHTHIVLHLLRGGNEWNTRVILLHPKPLQHLNQFVGFGSTHYKELLAVICLIVVNFYLQA
jgi:hypothetical protein